ncbi:Ankyrin repeat protein [Sporomusa ovata DSM 2662]|nr:ankyrin repeat domain-containing protein [Sporomusa ovata]EQB28432.1 ankyrin repeat-containing domain-containing protein [Sporomusa ovata DSM 2662]
MRNMWAKLIIKIKEAIEQTKGIKPPTVSKPDFAGLFSKVKVAMGSLLASLEPKHLVYFALILLPAIVGLGTYYGIMDSKAKLAAANLPENQLFRMGVNFTADDFVKYAGRGEKGITTLFLQAGMGPDSYRKADGFTPLHAASAYGRTPIVRLLLDQGADINARDKDGQTALMKAVWNSHANVVTVLLQRGANITVNDGKGNNSVSMAIIKNDRRVLEALVQAGVTELKDALDKVASVSNSDKPLTTPDSKPQGTKTSSYNSAASKPLAAMAGPPGQFTLATAYAGNIGVGKSVAPLYQEFGEQAVTDGEAYLSGRIYPVLRAYNQSTGSLSLIIFFAQGKENEKIVTAIHVFDERYRTGNGIGVGTTLGELRRASGVSSIQYTDSLYAITRDGKMRYELDISADSLPIDWLNGGDSSSLPADMKIKSIYIF